MKTKYSYKQIWTISYPILISLTMEQMIGMTDDCFLGRVGEIELGASAIVRCILPCHFMMVIRFSIGAQILTARRNGEGNYKEIGPIFIRHIFPACHGSDFIHVLHRILTIYPQEYHFVSSHLRCSRELYSLACVRVLLLFYHGDVPRLLCRYDADQDADFELLL